MKRPSLIRVQCLSDLRRFRGGLAIWWGLLLLDLAFNWSGRTPSPDIRGWEVPLDAAMLLRVFLLDVVMVLLPALVMAADSPSRPDGFLNTRPFPRQDWFTAKALFLLVGVVLPPVFTEGVYLGGTGLPGGVVLHAMLEDGSNSLA